MKRAIVLVVCLFAAALAAQQHFKLLYETPYYAIFYESDPYFPAVWAVFRGFSETIATLQAGGRELFFLVLKRQKGYFHDQVYFGVSGTVLPLHRYNKLVVNRKSFRLQFSSGDFTFNAGLFIVRYWLIVDSKAFVDELFSTKGDKVLINVYSEFGKETTLTLEKKILHGFYWDYEYWIKGIFAHY